MLELSGADPAPPMRQAQIHADAGQSGVRVDERGDALGVTAALRLDQKLLEIQRCVHQPLRHGEAAGARKLLCLGHQPLQQIEAAREDHHLIHRRAPPLPHRSTGVPAGVTDAFETLCRFDTLLAAFRAAARGRRGRPATARFEARLEDRLHELRAELRSGAYRPGHYTHFTIHEPKRRRISAAPFRDRIVHHALCSVIEPRLERRFVPQSFANRRGLGTHRAIDRVQQLARRYRYALRCDVVRYFPSIDHAILRDLLASVIPETDVCQLIDRILASGAHLASRESPMMWLPGDDLLAACRPRGLPIGNLTSQLFANVYLHPIDQLVLRELRCTAYARYVDDLVLFADDKRTLWRWRQAIIERLLRLRLTIHGSEAQVIPTASGIPWLGFVISPSQRRVKARNVRHATRRLRRRARDYREGRIELTALTASVRGWIEHVRHAGAMGLRRHVLRGLRISP